MKASRYFEIIRYAQKNLDIKDMSEPMNEKEKRFFESIKKELIEWRAKGIEPMFDFPAGFEDEEDECSENIYSDDFDDKVKSRLEDTLNTKINMQNYLKEK